MADRTLIATTNGGLKFTEDGTNYKTELDLTNLTGGTVASADLVAISQSGAVKSASAGSIAALTDGSKWELSGGMYRLKSATAIDCRVQAIVDATNVQARRLVHRSTASQTRWFPLTNAQRANTAVGSSNALVEWSGDVSTTTVADMFIWPCPYQFEYVTGISILAYVTGGSTGTRTFKLVTKLLDDSTLLPDADAGGEDSYTITADAWNTITATINEDMIDDSNNVFVVKFGKLSGVHTKITYRKIGIAFTKTPV